MRGLIDKNFKVYTKEQVDELNVKEYKDNYFVDRKGNVYRIFIQNGVHYVKKITPSISKIGYYQCGAGLIHNMVAEVFLGPRPKGLMIDHIDRNKLNNSVDNLRYVTLSDIRLKQKRTSINYVGRYYWNQGYYRENNETIPMTPEQYIQFVIDTKGVKVAKNILNKAKAKNPSLNLDFLFKTKNITMEDEIMEINPKETMGTGNSIVYLYYYNIYKDLADKTNEDKFLCKIGCVFSDDTSKIFTQSYKFMPEYPELALIIKTDTPNELLTTIQFILKTRTKQPTNVTDPSWILTNPKEIKDIYNLILGV